MRNAMNIASNTARTALVARNCVVPVVVVVLVRAVAP